MKTFYSEIKICIYLELSFCWKTNITDPQKKKRSPLLTHSLIDWWCCLGQAASEIAIREQKGWVLFNKIPFKEEKKSQNSRSCIWNQWNIVVQVHSLKNKENGIEPWSHSYDINWIWRTPAHTASVWHYLWRDTQKWGYGISVSYWIIPANTDLSKELYSTKMQYEAKLVKRLQWARPIALTHLSSGWSFDHLYYADKEVVQSS